MLNIFMSNKFFEKNSIFWENHEKLFWWRIWPFFKERGRLTPKINVTFFITNSVPSILLLNKFFEKSSIFGKNYEEPFVGGHDHFEGMGAFRDKSQYNFFGRKWGFKYFSFDDFSEKNNIFRNIREK